MTQVNFDKSSFLKNSIRHFMEHMERFINYFLMQFNENIFLWMNDL